MEDYLYHHGILGQKWGVRRFQNEDGSLTRAGRRRVKKLNKTRERLIKYYNFEKRGGQKEVDDIKRSIEDLKKYGKSSDTYADMRKEQYVEMLREEEQARTGDIYARHDEDYEEQYNTMLEKYGRAKIDQILDSKYGTITVQDMIDEFTRTRDSTENFVKRTEMAIKKLENYKIDVEKDTRLNMHLRDWETEDKGA